MKRQLLVRCIGMGLAGCLSLAGCADRNVNYDIDEAEEAEQSRGGKNGAEQLTNHLGIFRFSFLASIGSTVDLNEMELIYFRMRDRKNQGYYSYVPAWRLADVVRDVSGRITGISNQVLINAIDGSVIDFYEEV